MPAVCVEDGEECSGEAPEWRKRPLTSLAKMFSDVRRGGSENSPSTWESVTVMHHFPPTDAHAGGSSDEVESCKNTMLECAIPSSLEVRRVVSERVTAGDVEQFSHIVKVSSPHILFRAHGNGGCSTSDKPNSYSK